MLSISSTYGQAVLTLHERQLSSHHAPADLPGKADRSDRQRHRTEVLSGWYPSLFAAAAPRTITFATTV